VPLEGLKKLLALIVDLVQEADIQLFAEKETFLRNTTEI
jgi:hypothetical protein